MATFAVKNLTFAYPGKDVPALRDISFDVEIGEMVAVCGQSGSGKSTLLRNLKPALTPHGEKIGEVLFYGKPLEQLEKKQQASRIGYVLQDPDSQIVTDKVWHELAFGLENLGMDTKTIRLRVAEMASFFGIQTWFHKDVNHLSGGQKQLLNLASVMAMQPDVLILDEPTSQLDPIAAGDFLETVRKINRESGTTVVITEHRLEDVIPMCDRAIVLDQGRIIANDMPANVGAILAEKNHPMFMAMPTPLQAYALLYQKGIGKELPCPIDVRGGRNWLTALFAERDIRRRGLPVEEEGKQDAKPVLEMKDVWFRYSRQDVDVIKDLSFAVYPGELFCLVGGNGTGKSTAISLASGIRKPYRGVIKIKDRNIDKYKRNELFSGMLGVLPQNPQSIFVEKTVRLDLLEIFEGQDIADAEKHRRVEEIAQTVEIGHLLEMHPFDLSGGEQQRAALAKVLLLEPEILFLDEPTKGLDSSFKFKMAAILRRLKEKGVTVVMVSHDVEFCGRYGDRCAMFFDGKIITTNTPRAFFSGNSFYTTAANRMSRHIFENAVTVDDIAALVQDNLDGKGPETGGGGIDAGGRSFFGGGADRRSLAGGERGGSLSGGVDRCLSMGAVGDGSGFPTEMKGLHGEVSPGSAELEKFPGSVESTDSKGLMGTTGSKNLSQTSDSKDWFVSANPKDLPETPGLPRSEASRPKRVSKKLIDIGMLLMAALTILAGFYIFNNKRYFVVCFLIVIYAMIPFFVSFERRKPKAREIVILAVMIATAVCGRAAFMMVPSFKPIVAIIIISGVALGKEAGFLVGAMSAFVSNFLFGQGPWVPWQMMAMALIGYLAGLIFHKHADRVRKLPVIVFGAVAAFFLYGFIVDIWTILVMADKPTLEMAVMVYTSAAYLNLMHAIATAVFLFLLLKPMTEKLGRVKTKYGMEVYC